MTIPVQPEPDRTMILSLLESQADTVYQNVFLGDEADIFTPPDERDRQVYGKNGNDVYFNELSADDFVFSWISNSQSFQFVI